MPAPEILDGDTASHAIPSLASDDLLELLGGMPVVRLIGSGSTGRVYECIDNQSSPAEHGRHIAIKVLHPPLTSAAFVDRLRRQTILLGGVRSHCLARVFGVGEHEGMPLVMEELLVGENLQTRLNRDGKIPARIALRAVRDAARGLRAAFEVGVVHGDVKPANLFLHEGRVKLDDFGLMSDENASPTKDMFALGRTLYTLLTAEHIGSTVFVDDAVLPGASPQLRALLQCLLAPALRPATYDELIERIEDTIAGRTTTSVPAAVPFSLPAAPLAPPTAPTAAATRATLASAVRANAHPLRIERTSTPMPAGADADPFSVSSASSSGFAAAPTGVMGSLKQMSVAEIAQTLELGRKTARVEVQAIGASAGVFACRAGQVVFARSGDVVGVEAFFALAAHSDGFFRIHYGSDTDEPNIKVPTQFLLLETMRRIDERHAPVDEHTHPSPAPAPKPGRHPDFAEPPGTLPQAVLESGFDQINTTPNKEALGPTPTTQLLPRSWSMTLRSLRRLLLRAGDHVHKLLEQAKREAAALKGGGPLGPVLAMAVVVGAVVVVLVVVLVVVSSSGFSLAKAIADIDAGRASEVLDDLDEPSSPAEHLARGHALVALERDADALDAYGVAATARFVDERALAWVLGRLNLEAPDRALDLLQTWPDPLVQSRLLSLVSDPEWRVRHNAATALRERDELTDNDRERLALLDLNSGPLCTQRREGLLVLKELGVSDEAVAAILQAAKTKKGDNACLAQDLAASLGAVSGRAKQARTKAD